MALDTRQELVKRLYALHRQDAIQYSDLKEQHTELFWILSYPDRWNELVRLSKDGNYPILAGDAWDKVDEAEQLLKELRDNDPTVCTHCGKSVSNG